MGSGKPREIGIAVAVARCNYCGVMCLSLDHPDGGISLGERSHPCPGSFRLVRHVRWGVEDLARMGIRATRRRTAL